VTFEGRYHRADAELLPRGPRPGGPPIMIAGKRPRMMRLVARFADEWNAAWYGMPQEATELAERIARQRAACEVEGRVPASLALSAGIFVAFPHLLAGGDGEEPPEDAIRGDVDFVAEALAAYTMHGVEHVIAHVWPRTAGAVAELARAAELARTAARIGPA
jgi:alkanesulfonate monooxygenase SsuD/methylene tetrahydromethanopterin reductase-like flavin-dependent oxidoreductase (luciferase family)